MFPLCGVMSKRIYILSILFLFVPLLALASPSASSTASPAGASVASADALRLEKAAGGTWTLDTNGRGTLVVFWGIWCEPCRAGMAPLKALTERWSPRGIQVVIANTDGAEFRERIQEITSKETLPMLSTIDEDARVNRRLTGSIATPAMVLLEPNGHVRWKGNELTGSDAAALERHLRALTR